MLAAVMAISWPDSVDLILNVVIVIVMAVVGLAFRSTLADIGTKTRLAVAEMKSDYEEALRDMEDRIVDFIRKHEQDSFAHPNLETIRIITNKLDAIEQSITMLTIMIEKHIARENK